MNEPRPAPSQPPLWLSVSAVIVVVSAVFGLEPSPLYETPVFTPLREGLVAWYDGADRATILTSVEPDVVAQAEDPVRRWLDKSGHGFHLYQDDPHLQPTLDLESSRGHCAGIAANHSLLRWSGDALSIVQDASYTAAFMIVDGRSGSGRPRLLEFQTGLRSGTPRISVVATGGTQQFVVGGRVGDRDDFISTSVPIPQRSILLTAIWDWEAGHLSVYLNGAKRFSEPLWSPGRTDATPSLAAGMCMRPSAPTDHWNGTVSEVLIYNTRLDDLQIARLHEMLQAKWGYVLTIPADLGVVSALPE